MENRGKHICNTLKAIRLDIAHANGIEYAPIECHHKGNCSGSCPACEGEMRYLEREIARRHTLGKAALVAGLSLGLMSFTPAPGNTIYTSVEEVTSIDALIQISGTVLDENHEPLIGAIVALLNNPKKGVATDFDGHFTLSVPKGSKIKVTYIGYEDVVVEVKDGMTITLKPSDNVILCGEVVVVKSHAKNAQYPGGDKALQKFIKKNFVLPDDITGREYVMIEVDVDKKGNVSNPRILNEIGTAFEREALRVAGLIKKIKPARDAKGKKTDSTYSIVFDSNNWANVSEQAPKFPGGNAALIKYIMENFQYPPSSAAEIRSFKVIVEFFVDEHGKVVDVKILRSVDQYFDREMIRVIKSLPVFIPGRDANNEPIGMWYTMPIDFHMQANQ